MSTENRPYSKRDARLATGRGEGDEFVFRFPLGEGSEALPPNLREMLESQLRGLLQLLMPLSAGKEIPVDGYRLLNDPDHTWALKPQEKGGATDSKDVLDLYEPRVRYLQRLLEAVLGVVDLEVQGETVRVDGFRLKNLDQWLVSSGGAGDILAHAATRCNVSCRFCYNKGLPPILQPEIRSPEEEYDEILTRIRHYVPGSRLALFPRMGSPCEALAHPRIMDMLAALRDKTSEVLRIPTNGSLLTPELIAALAERKPVFLDVSLNSASPTRRRWLMNDPRPQIALKSLARLKAARIPYSVVIVPWPFPSLRTMLEDLEKTVAFAAKHKAAFIQISLPGYSRFFAPEPLFDRERVWSALRERVQRLRSEAASPIILRPGLYEEFRDPEAVQTPRLVGVVTGSPAARAGVQAGDRILKVSGIKVKNRSQARYLLGMLHRSDVTKAPLCIERGGEFRNLEMDLHNWEYPYDPRAVPLLGMIFPSSGIPEDWLERLRAVIQHRGAKRVLLLTSTLVRPSLEKRIREAPFFSGIALHFQVPLNLYMGGNIIMGDLLVVEDFVEAIRTFLADGAGTPDLVVIPSSAFHLSGWGRDLTGTAYTEIERRTGIPVAVVECDPIFD